MQMCRNIAITVMKRDRQYHKNNQYSFMVVMGFMLRITIRKTGWHLSLSQVWIVPSAMTSATIKTVISRFVTKKSG